MIDPKKPIEAVGENGNVLMARIIATDVKAYVGGGYHWLCLVLDHGCESLFVMSPERDKAFAIGSDDCLRIRNRREPSENG